MYTHIHVHSSMKKRLEIKKVSAIRGVLRTGQQTNQNISFQNRLTMTQDSLKTRELKNYGLHT